MMISLLKYFLQKCFKQKFSPAIFGCYSHEIIYERLNCVFSFFRPVLHEGSLEHQGQQDATVASVGHLLPRAGHVHCWQYHGTVRLPLHGPRAQHERGGLHSLT